ncbi:MAG TPA: carbamate kinase [Symbiobacteriaceae bacterium]|jgi:carbamate kinase|nr:carbamate kinase [Symbiobacteriaceae bacterium]
MSTIVIALGGNAILQPGQKGTAAEQAENIRKTCVQVAAMIEAGHRVIVTHGNGPQVGNLLIQQEEASAVVPPMPMDVAGAMSQGMLGYWMQNQLGNLLRERGIARPVVTVVTQVLVDREDPAFQNPTKPVGPFYTQARAERHMTERGWQMKEDAGRGWRRVVPSPDPKAIWEKDAINTLVESGAVVVCSGGGGVPVFLNENGLQGCEAVIDKDLAGQRLAADVDADLLCILTDVPKVALRYRQPDEQLLNRVTAAEMRRYLAEGHFKPGSMGPKVEAVLRFVEATGKWGVISSLDDAAAAVEGEAGTVITP